MDPYRVLALRYRPQTFDALVGQEHVTRTLRNAIAQDRIAHAFLFTGIRGVGKTSAARLLAQALNCERSDKPTPQPCGACSNCAEIAASRSVDVAEIDGASNRGIDSVRELNDNVRYLPAKSRFRVYIIDEAHMVTKEAFNALLKTLEEPPTHVKFIFATTAVDKFPDTIVSRCQRYDFRRLPLSRLLQVLKDIAAQEGIALSESALRAVAREADGSVRDAESLLERLIAFSGGAIGDAEVAEVLGVADRQTILEAADAVLAAEPRRALQLVDAVHAAGRDLEHFSRDLLGHWRNLVVVKLYGQEAVAKDVAAEELGELARQAELRSLQELQRLFRVARQGDEELRSAVDPRLALEMTMVRLATLEPVVSIDEALARLSEIEAALRGAPMPRAAAAPPARSLVSRPDAAAGPPLDAPPACADPPSANGDRGGRWSEFLEYVQGRKISLYLTLSHARLVGEAGGQIVLGVAKESYRKELARRETLALVEDLAGQFFAAPTRIRIEVAEEAAEPAAAAGVLDDPAVKKAVEILGGEVREVRNRR